MMGIQLSADYDPRIRLVRDEEGRIIEGLTLGETLPQNQALILTLHQGELKEAPAVGCGISDMLLDNQPLYWRRVTAARTASQLFFKNLKIGVARRRNGAHHSSPFE